MVYVKAARDSLDPSDCFSRRPFPFEKEKTKKEPAVGLEPTTPALRMLCSAIELRWPEPN